MYKNVIAIFFLLCEIVSADCLLYESEAFAIEAADEYRRSCESYGGGGGVFSFSVSKSSSNNTCDGLFAENAYVLKVSCNTCGSSEIKEELQQNKKYCNEKCKSASMTCMSPLDSWGSTLNGSIESCGLDDTSLPGCAESSSSSEMSSSSSKKIDSSSSGKKASKCKDKYFHYECTVNTDHCYGIQDCGGEVFSSYCDVCEKVSRLRCEGPGYWHTAEWCDYHLSWSGGGNTTFSFGCIQSVEQQEQECDDYGGFWNEETCECDVIPSSSSYTSSSNSLSSSSENKSSSSEDSSSSKFETSSSFMESSSSDKSSSSFKESSSSEVSSSSESSSSSEFSSSSEKSSSSEESSSSEPPSSSSLSSSSEESSSSSEEIVVESSSVMPVDEPFVAGPDQVYTPDQIFSSGLQNMEPGACYSLNPDRGTQHGWINNNAQDSWWWREVDCTTGEKVDRNRVGQCPGFPLDRVPSNPTSACFAYNGSCYKCNPNRGSDCASDWLWLWTFTPSNVGWWYEKVDCYDPFGEEDDLKCYEIVLNDDENDDFILLKQQSKESESYEELSTINDGVNIINKIYYYDALGRNISKNKLKNKKSYFINFKDLESEQSLVTHILKRDKTYSGYVKGSVVINWCETKKEKDGEYKINHIKVSMNVISGPIHVESNDERLIAHEKKHKDIWDDEKYKKTQTLTVSIPKNKTKKEVCELEAERSWAYVRDDLYDLYTRHNNWDDSDPNNYSHARLNIPELMQKHKKTFLNKCK